MEQRKKKALGSGYKRPTIGKRKSKCKDTLMNQTITGKDQHQNLVKGPSTRKPVSACKYVIFMFVLDFFFSSISHLSRASPKDYQKEQEKTPRKGEQKTGNRNDEMTPIRNSKLNHRRCLNQRTVLQCIYK